MFAGHDEGCKPVLNQSRPIWPIYENGSHTYRGPHASADRLNVGSFLYIIREWRSETPESGCMTGAFPPALS